MTKDKALKLALVIAELRQAHAGHTNEGPSTFSDAADLLEAMAQPVQEPVATMKMLHTYGDTTQPQRLWVGLTDDEIEYWIGCNTAKPALVRAISKALKEKNFD